MSGAVFLTNPEAFSHGVWTKETPPKADIGAPTPRIVASASVGGFPFVVGVRIDGNKILADWRMRAILFTGIATTFSMCLIAFGLWTRSTLQTERKLTHYLHERALLHTELAAHLDAEREQVRLIDIIAHQIRTPLATLQLNMELLSNNALGTEERGRVIERVLRTFTRLKNLVNDTLLESRRIAAYQRANLKEVGLFSTIEGITSKIRDLIESHPTTARFENIHPGLVIKADVSMLDIALINLVENAVKYSPAGSGIDIVCSNKNDHVDITITNSGTGIPEADLAHLTEKYYRGQNALSVPGMGLGLRMVEMIAKAHGGRFKIENGEKGYVLVTLSLPLTSKVTPNNSSA